MHCNRRFLLVTGLCLQVFAFTASGQEPSAADILEFRAPAAPRVGQRTLAIGFEQTAPHGTGSVHELGDGRFMMIGGGNIRFSTDSGHTWKDPESLNAPIRFAIRLRNGTLAGPSTDNVFYTSGDGGKIWQKTAGGIGTSMTFPLTIMPAAFS